MKVKTGGRAAKRGMMDKEMEESRNERQLFIRSALSSLLPDAGSVDINVFSSEQYR